MEEFTLIPHPDFPCAADITMSVLVERVGGALTLIYSMAGDDSGVRVPAPGDGRRTNELWKHTCFEAFIKVAAQSGYSELNFSPWGEWAAYSFDDYRTGMRDLVGSEEPFAYLGYKAEMPDGSYGWQYSTIEAFDPTADWRLGLTAVIETIDGTKSYWALAHAPGPPDFHNPDCFLAALPAPDPT